MVQTIFLALQSATTQLHAVSDTSRLDAEILLCHVLKKPRSFLFTSPEIFLTDEEQNHFLELLTRRAQSEPIAYLTGHREFWSLDFVVTKNTLIPRPETELLVELALEKCVGEKQIIADLGTGSGAIALAIAHEKPNWSVHATDVSLAALQVAELNAKRLNCANVSFHQGDWCQALPPLTFDAIISNPPYIADYDQYLAQKELTFEPQTALVADEGGLFAIRQVIYQAKSFLNSGGYLLLEHGFQQADTVRKIFAKAGYTGIVTHSDLAGLDRVTVAAMVLA